MKRDLISGVFWLCIGLTLCVWSSAYQIGAMTQPGPGFLPLALGGIVAFFALVLIVRTVRSGKRKGWQQGAPMSMRRQNRVFLTILVLLVAAFLFEKVGYLLTFFLLSLLLLLIAGVKSWIQIGVIAVCSTLGIYIVFVLLLKQPLPTGLLGV